MAKTTKARANATDTLESSNGDDDVAAASAVATEAHTAWHLLKDPAYQYLAEAVGFEMDEDHMSDADTH